MVAFLELVKPGIVVAMDFRGKVVADDSLVERATCSWNEELR